MKKIRNCVALTCLLMFSMGGAVRAADILALFEKPDACYEQSFTSASTSKQYPDLKIQKIAVWKSEYAGPGEPLLSLFVQLADTKPRGLPGEWIIDAQCNQEGGIVKCAVDGRGGFTLNETRGLEVTLDPSLLLESYEDPSVYTEPASEWLEGNPPLLLHLSDDYPCGQL